jgi:hypothetical protein
MKRNFYFLVIFFGFTLITSCSLRRIGKAVPTSSLNTQVNLTMEDLDYIGEVKGTSTQTYLLGIPIGGKRQYYGQIGVGSSGFSRSPAFQNRGMDNALYEALNSKPDLDFVLPIAYDFEVNRMFLGRKVKINVRAKAFKIKLQTAPPVEEKKDE